MDTVWNAILDLLTTERVAGVVRALVIVVVGFTVAGPVGRAVDAVVARRATPQSAMLARRLVAYAIYVVALLSALTEVGFDLKILVGAAGVLSVAIGFASQTSASNLISGLFLVGERPFVVGDVIRIGTTTGEVISIDLMSVKLRTYDNLFVRIPNESVIKSEVTNITHFPIRRYDLQVGVAYRSDLRQVREILLEAAAQNVACLDEPAPLVIFQGYGESSMNLQLSVWAAREDVLDVRNNMGEAVKEALDAAGIEIPFPHRTLYAGVDSAPLPVRVVEPDIQA